MCRRGGARSQCPPLSLHSTSTWPSIAIDGASWKHKGKAKSLDVGPASKVTLRRRPPRHLRLPATPAELGSRSEAILSPVPQLSPPLPVNPYLGQVATGSGSVFSLSFSGSLDETDELGCRGGASETQCSSGSRNPEPTSTSYSPLSSSSLLPHLTGLHLNFSSARQEEEKVACHPLPLPPGSLNSSSHAFTNSGLSDTEQSLRSKWKKGKLLGSGTFGHVYLGFNCENGNMCAIKEVGVIPDDQSSKESLKQLNQEIALLGQLSHPNIVQYYGSELAEESLSVYLEYVSGGSIHMLLKEYGPFGEPVIRNYAKQILSGLAYLHERNTVHRDIKGANILVDPNGGIKLADFGMAKHINSCTNALSFKGSPHWIAPEVIMNTNGYNLAVDIWSLGCTVLEMATSKAPWSQFEGVAALFKIGNSNDIPEIPEHVSDDGKNFLKLCLQRNPSARPTAAQLLEHPFVREPTSAEVVTKNKISKDFLHSSDKSICLQEYSIRHKAASSTVPLKSREKVHPRLIMSLPVYPCSSPLRQFGGSSHANCLTSPPHPKNVGAGFGFDTYPICPPRGRVNQTRKSSASNSDFHLLKH